MLDTETEDTEKCVTNAQTWSNYVERLANPVTAANNKSSGTSSGTGVIISGTTNANSSDTIEIKAEKMDEDVVSGII